jgi:ElaB/YqjD/DUF883 family membrane-anchored ribosome-binding protein
MTNDPTAGMTGAKKQEGGNGADSDVLQTAAKNIGGSAGQAAGTASALAHTAQEYGQKISEAAGQAKEYVEEKVAVVSDKIKELNFAELTENCKQYARQNPGQAILISAGAGLLLGLLIRVRR